MHAEWHPYLSLRCYVFADLEQRLDGRLQAARLALAAADRALQRRAALLACLPLDQGSDGPPYSCDREIMFITCLPLDMVCLARSHSCFAATHGRRSEAAKLMHVLLSPEQAAGSWCQGYGVCARRLRTLPFFLDSASSWRVAVCAASPSASTTRTSDVASCIAVSVAVKRKLRTTELRAHQQRSTLSCNIVLLTTSLPVITDETRCIAKHLQMLTETPDCAVTMASNKWLHA